MEIKRFFVSLTMMYNLNLFVMRKFYILLSGLLVAFALNAQQTLTLQDNSWTEGEESFSNSQGMISLEPTMTIAKGFKVVVSFEGTTTGDDVTLSAIVVDTVNGGWVVASSWESASVSNGSIAKTFSFTVTNAVEAPTLVLSTPSNKVYNETITFSKLECTVFDPSYRDPNTTVDTETLTLNELNCSWEGASYNSQTKTITFDKAWTGQGWAWWGTGLDISAYKSVTVEFEPVDCQVKLFAQKFTSDDDVLNGESKVAEAGATSVTLDFGEMFAPFPQDMVHQICILRETAGDIVLTAVYLTYTPTADAIDDVAETIQIKENVVYSKGLISVYNIAGKKVAESFLELDLSSLVQGIYIIKAEEGTIKMFK